MTMMKNLPDFFNYNEEGKTDYGYEAMQDFFISWTLRCSQDQFEIGNAKVHVNSKRLLYSLLYGKNKDKKYEVDFTDFSSFKVLNVKTRRQYGNIDILADVEVKLNGQTDQFGIIIENKWYTRISPHQLEKYSEFISNNLTYNKKKVVKIVLFCDDTFLNKFPSEIELCQKFGYKYSDISELATISGIYDLKETGNALFDEYWYNL